MPRTADWSSSLACRFMAELLERTLDMVDEAAHQQAVQAFLDDLRPCLHPADGLAPRATFSVFSKIEIDLETEAVSVAFSREGWPSFGSGCAAVALTP
ncbi:MAG: hypothetical protein OEU26_04870 [Candidatus Tectomicrobia bacterium]|nr:hypothetical protein [Candidatus Tectomicrobia bacterium]